MIRAPGMLLAAVVSLAVTASGQQAHFTFSGQAWGSGSYGDDPLDNYAKTEGAAGYIPELNLRAGQPGGAQLELLVAFRASYLYRQRLSPEQWTMAGSERVYRLWMQLRSARWDLRLGRQKLAFGPGQFLRPLAWFDTLDLRDPTGQTLGVDAVRWRYFLNDRLSVWGWGILQSRGALGYDLENFSPGGRAEYLLGDVELGFTFHQENFSGRSTPRSRVALDLRTDKVVGLWAEASALRDNNDEALISRTDVLMVGVDYTLPIGSGILVMAEHLQSRSVNTAEGSTPRAQATAVLGALPLGLFDRLTAVAYFLHDANFSSYFFMWQRTYDRFSMSALMFANPPRSELGFLGNIFPSVVGAGTSVQLLLVYHH